jgi:hypothetical protein
MAEVIEHGLPAVRRLDGLRGDDQDNVHQLAVDTRQSMHMARTAAVG